MKLLKCLKCGQKPNFETHPVENDADSSLVRLVCQCGAGTWHPFHDDYTPLGNEWNTANTPAPVEFKMEMPPEPPEHKLVEHPEPPTVTFVNGIPILNAGKPNVANP
jgi:hypothetical protein